MTAQQQPAPAADATAALERLTVAMAAYMRDGTEHDEFVSDILAVLALARIAAGVQPELGAWMAAVRATEAAHREIDVYTPDDVYRAYRLAWEAEYAHMARERIASDAALPGLADVAVGDYAPLGLFDAGATG